MNCLSSHTACTHTQTHIICQHTHTYIHTNAHRKIHTRTHTHIHTRTHTYTHTHTQHTRTHTHTQPQTHTHTYTHAHTHVTHIQERKMLSPGDIACYRKAKSEEDSLEQSNGGKCDIVSVVEVSIRVCATGDVVLGIVCVT